ncbi:MAG: PAS domain S-box protein, partial [Betaproteobacteria bacterium]|nr:PAS domain S-box protein [Betaproteobacteria bacterium]
MDTPHPVPDPKSAALSKEAPKDPAAARAGKIELPWLVLGALLVSTLFGGWQAARQQAAEADQRFAELAADTHTSLERRIESIRLAVSSVAAFGGAQPRTDSAAWQQFIGNLGLNSERLTGLVAVRQPTANPAEPLDWQVAKAAGVKRPWEVLATFAGTDPSVSGFSLPMQLPDLATSYVIRVAIPGRSPPTHVYALIDMSALLKGAARRSDLEVSLVDGGTAVASDSVASAKANGGAPLRRSTQTIALLDREAALSMASTPTLEQRLTSQAPRMVLLVGLVSCALLGGLIWLLTRLRSQAEALAEGMTRKLTEQTRFTEDLIEHNPNPIFRKDVRGRFVSVNRAWEELTGHARADVVGKVYADLMPGNIATANEVHDLALLSSPEGRGVIETQLASASGTPIQAIVAKQVLVGEDGRAEGLIGTITDVTQLKALEREVEAQREQQALVIRSSQQGVWDASESPDVLPFYSDRFKEILGFAPGEFPDKFDWKDVLHEDDAPRFKAEMVRLFKRETKLFDVEARAAADGRFRL